MLNGADSFGGREDSVADNTLWPIIDTVLYRVVTMNKMAVVIQRENLAADFRVVLLFVSILKLVRHETLLLKG